MRAISKRDAILVDITGSGEGCGVTTIQPKRFDEPDERLELGDKGPSEIVNINDVMVDRILLGRREASNALLPEEKRAVAVHEAGHAIVAALSENADPVAKVTILPAGRALGVTEQLPEDERRIYPESYLRDSLAIRLGGRAAERLVLGEISSGASNDLAGATQLATRMVREFGMSPRLGPVGFSEEGPQYLGAQQLTTRHYAEETSA